MFPDRKRRLLGQPNALDPCGIDNIDWESSQERCPDIVPVGFDGVRNTCQKISRGCLLQHDASSFQKFLVWLPAWVFPVTSLQSITKFFKFLPGEQRQAFLHEVTEKAS
jgi:hypothetical protein